MKRLRWALIGAGDIARKRVAPALRDLANCELVSISRSKTDLAQSFANEFGARKWCSDWREQIVDHEIDAVYVATPVYLHAHQTIAAAASGRHVLCEKPMALTVAECDEMIAACQKNDVKLGIAYYRHFYPAIERAKQIIASGEIGRVVIGQINAFENFDPAAEDPRHWLVEKDKSGGGPMIDFGCHRIEVLMNLFGPVRRIRSLVSSDMLGHEVEDTATALLQFQSGICASLTVTHAAIERQDTLDIFGTRGSIRISALNAGNMVIRSGNQERNELYPPAANFHAPLIADFTDAVLNDREPAVTGETGRRISQLIERIYSDGS
jgi:predicted dehydrogenase